MSGFDPVKDIGMMTPPIYGLTDPDNCCDCGDAVLVLRRCDFSLCVSLSYRVDFGVDGQEGGGCPRCVVGEIQEHTGLFLHVEGGSYVETDVFHVLPQLFNRWHRAHVLDPEARGIRVEPGDLIRDMEAGLSESLVSAMYRGLARHFEGCRQDCLNVVARLLIGGKRPRDWGNGTGGRSLANRGTLLGIGYIEEPREESSQYYATCNTQTCCGDGIWGLEQPASGCMMEETLAEISQSF